jgi:hypothetical protein
MILGLSVLELVLLYCKNLDRNNTSKIPRERPNPY